MGLHNVRFNQGHRRCDDSIAIRPHLRPIFPSAYEFLRRMTELTFEGGQPLSASRQRWRSVVHRINAFTHLSVARFWTNLTSASPPTSTSSGTALASLNIRRKRSSSATSLRQPRGTREPRLGTPAFRLHDGQPTMPTMLLRRSIAVGLGHPRCAFRRGRSPQIRKAKIFASLRQYLFAI